MEHGIIVPDDDDRWAPLKQGLVCFFAFAIFGLIPLLGFIVLYAIEGEATSGSGKVLGVAYALTAATLFGMGVSKAVLTGEERYVRSGLLMVLNGTIAGGVAYLVG